MLESVSYFSLFLSSFLAATFLPFSSEAILATMYFNKFSVPSILIIATLGNTVGGMLTYYIGKMGKLEWIQKYLKIKKENIQKYQLLVKSYGSFLAFFCWLPIIGDPLALVLGFFKVSPAKVFLYMISGKAIRYIILIIIFKYSS